MAWGISPRNLAIIPLGDYNADHYLTLLYQAFVNLGWHTSYFDHDGIIAYTNISWESYAEEVSVRIVNNEAIVKSECVGYQFFFYDYGKNAKNLELLFVEIEYAEFHLHHQLNETAQQLMDGVPEKQFISLDDPPMGAKETLRSFLSAFIPRKNYFITPLLVLVNTAIYIISIIAIAFMIVILLRSKSLEQIPGLIEKIYLAVGFDSRSQVLSGQVWRLITNTFLHFSLMHLAGNMVVLIYIGSLIEAKLGKWNYLLLYLFTGLCASVTSVLWREQGIAGGASGAIFGLFGVLLALLSTGFYERNARRALLISTAIFVAINIFPTSSRIDHAAHFGGLISGYILGWIAYLGLKYKSSNLITIGALAATLLFTGLSLKLAPNYQLKEYMQLTRKVRTLSADLQDDFYGEDTLTRTQKLRLIEHKGLPVLNTLKNTGRRLHLLALPARKKRLADIQSKIVMQEYIFYDLLYKEYRYEDRAKYRPAINEATDKINQLRLQMDSLTNDN